ncbi:MAG: GNAT family N-acetyltransferase, partial [Bacilli bacterium]
MDKIYTDRLMLLGLTEELVDQIKENSFPITFDGEHFDPAQGWPNVTFFSWLNRCTIEKNKYEWGKWIVIHRHTGFIIGCVGFSIRPEQQGTVEIVCEIGPLFQNHHYGTESVRG